MNSVGVFSFGRKQSARCPNKMLRPFGSTTLTDIVLAKLARCKEYTFFAGFEDEFRVKCDQHGVLFVHRDEKSARIDEPIVEILGFLRGVKCEWLLLVNASLPFMRLETIEKFLATCIGSPRVPAFSVIRRKNHFVGMDRRPLNFDEGLKTINTKSVMPVYEFGHALYYFERDHLLQHGTLWDWRMVRYIELNDRIEGLDIDTEEDFKFAEMLWRAMGGA